MPKPGNGESKKDFVQRCIPIVLKEGTAKTNEQAVAICYSMWGEKDKVKESKTTFPQNIHESLALSEANIVPDAEGKKSFRAWWPLLKEGPGNKQHKNYYSKKALETTQAKIVDFGGRNKMFFGHAAGDVQPRERDVKDWAASIRETKIENGVLYGLVQALDPWLKERMYDAPSDLAASIEARGKMGGVIEHEGEKWNLVEEVRWLNGFMIVDYPGNAPMGITLAESDQENGPKEETVETIAELKEKYPELWASIEKEFKEAAQVELNKVSETLKSKDEEIKKMKESQTSDQKAMGELKESLVKLESKLDGMEALSKKRDRDAKVAIEMGKLPKEAVTDKFKSLVESASDEKTALELIEERSKLFESKVTGHGKSEPKSAEEMLKEKEMIFAEALGHKIEEKKKE